MESYKRETGEPFESGIEELKAVAEEKMHEAIDLEYVFFGIEKGAWTKNQELQKQFSKEFGMPIANFCTDNESILQSGDNAAIGKYYEALINLWQKRIDFVRGKMETAAEN